MTAPRPRSRAQVRQGFGRLRCAGTLPPLPAAPPAWPCTHCASLALPTNTTAAVNTLARKTKAVKEGEANLAGEYIREGLGAVVSVKVRRGVVCVMGGGWVGGWVVWVGR